MTAGPSSPSRSRNSALEQREALVLRFTEELSYEEISALTGVGISALKMRVQRACARLRVLLEEHLLA